jgi:hypothetical protein
MQGFGSGVGTRMRRGWFVTRGVGISKHIVRFCYIGVCRSMAYGGQQLSTTQHDGGGETYS